MGATTVLTQERTRRSPRSRESEEPKRQPLHNVVLLDDDDHTYDYVVRMLSSLFRHSEPRAWRMAREVDASGRVILLTTTKEHAELKRDQIHAFGRDRLLTQSVGSMWAVIEPVE